jgi:hypothetical protein
MLSCELKYWNETHGGAKTAVPLKTYTYIIKRNEESSVMMLRTI